MKKFYFSSLLSLALLSVSLVLTSCEKMNVDVDDTAYSQSTVTIRASLFNIVPFDTRSVQDISEFCTHISFAVYDSDGNVVKTIEQNQGDSGYGEVTLSLVPATYKLLVLAHSSYGGTPSVSSPNNIVFTNKIGYSDTFYYYDDLVVTGENQSQTIQLQRAVTMLRFTITDEFPTDLNQIRFYWSGESGIFNATTGLGGAATNQMALYAVDGLSAPQSFRLFTFMREETGTLSLTVTAYDGNDNVIKTRTFADVPLKNRMVTEYSGRFFSSGASDNAFTLQAETEWSVYQQLTY